jgi:hypothetical protein
LTDPTLSANLPAIMSLEVIPIIAFICELLQGFDAYNNLTASQENLRDLGDVFKKRVN